MRAHVTHTHNLAVFVAVEHERLTPKARREQLVGLQLVRVCNRIPDRSAGRAAAA